MSIFISQLTQLYGSVKSNKYSFSLLVIVLVYFLPILICLSSLAFPLIVIVFYPSPMMSSAAIFYTYFLDNVLTLDTILSLVLPISTHNLEIVRIFIFIITLGIYELSLVLRFYLNYSSRALNMN